MSPQHGQRPSSLIGPVASARNQCPRASQIGLMHCTVKPGKYCMFPPPSGRSANTTPSSAMPQSPSSQKCNGCRALCARVAWVSRENTTISWGGVANHETLDFPSTLFVISVLRSICVGGFVRRLAVVVAFAATHHTGTPFAFRVPQDRRMRCTSLGWIHPPRECGSWRQTWQTARADLASP
jgi:hypothetical protein